MAGGKVNIDFIDALKQGNIEAIRRCPKADLHNHFVLGGNRRYLREHSGRTIQPITRPLCSMDEMHAWNAHNIGEYFNSTEGRQMLINATFAQPIENFKSIYRCAKAEELEEIRKNGLKNKETR